jgi:hypothetical protein
VFTVNRAVCRLLHNVEEEAPLRGRTGAAHTDVTPAALVESHRLSVPSDPVRRIVCTPWTTYEPCCWTSTAF